MKLTNPGLLSSETILAASIVVGIAVPPVSRMLGPYLYVFVFFLMLFSSLTISLKDAVPDRRVSRRLTGMLGWQMIALPVAIGMWHKFVPAAGQWSELMLVTACAGTIFGAPAFARVMRLDGLLTLRGVLAGTLLMPVVLGLLAPAFIQRTAGFDFYDYAGRLVIFIVLPLAVAAVYQARRTGDQARDHGVFNGLTVAFLVLFGIAVMDGIGPRFLQQPWNTVALLGFALAVHGIFFGLSFVIFLRWGHQQALTAGLLSGYRNLALVLAVGGSLLPPDFVVFVALWQIPMYIMPLAAKCWGWQGKEKL